MADLEEGMRLTQESADAEAQAEEQSAFGKYWDKSGATADTFDPASSGYDYDTARRWGMGPTGTGDNDGHWGSVAPASPEAIEQYGLPDGSYMLLKGSQHKTFNKAVAAEQARGSVIVKHGDRYYSVPNQGGPMDPITRHHYANIANGTAKRNDNGSLSTVYTAQVDGADGRPTLIPTIWDGKELSEEDAVAAANTGIQWPTADTHPELRQKDEQLHKGMLASTTPEEAQMVLGADNSGVYAAGGEVKDKPSAFARYWDKSTAGIARGASSIGRSFIDGLGNAAKDIVTSQQSYQQNVHPAMWDKLPLAEGDVQRDWGSTGELYGQPLPEGHAINPETGKIHVISEDQRLSPLASFAGYTADAVLDPMGGGLLAAKAARNLNTPLEEMQRTAGMFLGEKSAKGAVASALGKAMGKHHQAETIYKTTLWWSTKSKAAGGKEAHAAKVEYMSEQSKIWKQHGWYKEPETGQWKFEVDDSAASINMNPKYASSKPIYADNYTFYLEDVLEHEELYKYLPEAKNIVIRFEDVDSNVSGSFTPNGWWGEHLITVNKEAARGSDLGYAEAIKSTILHEVQHMAQLKEGFKKGTNKRRFKPTPDQATGIRAELKEISQVPFEQLTKSQHRRFTELQELIDLNADPYHSYKTTMGEVEARLVQKRRNLDRLKRSESYPEQSKSNMLHEEGIDPEDMHGRTGIASNLDGNAIMMSEGKGLLSKSEPKLIEAYVGNKAVPRLEDGSTPKALYRHMSKAEYDEGMKTGVFKNKGSYTHASATPDARYAEGDSVLVKIDYDDADGWSAKYGDGGSTVYAGTFEDIPASKISKVTKK